MQLGGKLPKQSSSLFDEDFASGFEDSKFDKFKPLIRVLAVLLVIAGLGIGGLWIYGNNASKNNYVAGSESSNLTDTYKPVSGVDEAAIKFNDCTKTATDKTKDLQTSDPDFSKKLITGYDEWLACYDKYPEQAANASPSRLSLESARQSAINSSGSYKDTYLSDNSYDYKPSSSGPNSTYTPTYNSTPSTSETANNPPVQPSNNSPSEWELNKAEFDRVVACADTAYSNNPTSAPYGSIAYYQQRDTQLRAQLACTDGVKYQLSKGRRSQYQSDIATNQSRLDDALDPYSSQNLDSTCRSQARRAGGIQSNYDRVYQKCMSDHR